MSDVDIDKAKAALEASERSKLTERLDLASVSMPEVSPECVVFAVVPKGVEPWSEDAYLVSSQHRAKMVAKTMAAMSWCVWELFGETDEFPQVSGSAFEVWRSDVGVSHLWQDWVHVHHMKPRTSWTTSV